MPSKDTPEYLKLVEADEFVDVGRIPKTRYRGGDGGGNGMEIRVAKLESDVEHLKRDVGELRTDMRDVRDRLTRIEERVAHLPGKGFIVTSVILSLAVVGSFVTFQEQIQRFAGTQPASIASQP